MTKPVSPSNMKEIDPISYSLWTRYVQPYVKRSRTKTSELKLLLEKGPMPGSPHPVIQNILRDGRGMDGFQSAMMTWNYLTALCSYHEISLQHA